MAVSAHILHSDISQSLLIQNGWLSATCHTYSILFQDIEKRNWDEIFFVKLNFKYILLYCLIIWLPETKCNRVQVLIITFFKLSLSHYCAARAWNFWICWIANSSLQIWFQMKHYWHIFARMGTLKSRKWSKIRQRKLKCSTISQKLS